jgi:uncharacterized protein (DUF1501 family)
VTVLTEFGRTPRVNYSAGRDHWGNANTMLLAGGQTRRGTVVGETHYNGMILGEALKAKDDAVVNTIIHAAANGRENDFLVFNEPRAREALK